MLEYTSYESTTMLLLFVVVVTVSFLMVSSKFGYTFTGSICIFVYFFLPSPGFDVCHFPIYMKCLTVYLYG